MRRPWSVQTAVIGSFTDVVYSKCVPTPTASTLCNRDHLIVRAAERKQREDHTSRTSRHGTYVVWGFATVVRS